MGEWSTYRVVSIVSTAPNRRILNAAKSLTRSIARLHSLDGSEGGERVSEEGEDGGDLHGC